MRTPYCWSATSPTCLSSRSTACSTCCTSASPALSTRYWCINTNTHTHTHTHTLRHTHTHTHTHTRKDTQLYPATQPSTCWHIHMYSTSISTHPEIDTHKR